MKDRRKNKAIKLAFTKTNYRIFALGILVLIVGYIALAQPPVDGFISLTAAPVLLVLAYCVIIPIAIMFTSRTEKE